MIREWEDRIVGNTQFVAKRKMKLKKNKEKSLLDIQNIIKMSNVVATEFQGKEEKEIGQRKNILNRY